VRPSGPSVLTKGMDHSPIGRYRATPPIPTITSDRPEAIEEVVAGQVSSGRRTSL
jgi:hypothetical protein